MKKFSLRFFICLLVGFLLSGSSWADGIVELNSGWRCAPVSKVNATGISLSQRSYSVKNWESAVVPGTVLTTMLANNEIPDPFYGMNNEKIPDIYTTGREHYTYWFVKDFTKRANKTDQVWLHFRGVNYSCDIYLNGHRVNKDRHYGMYLRQTYNITDLLASNGKNRLAVIVYPVEQVGNPNGGQGGDGRIARNVALQYVAGWDWIQPIRDRNTGIWDKVTLETTGVVNLKNPHVITLVPGKRIPGADQKPAYIKSSVELQNASDHSVHGVLFGKLSGVEVKTEYQLGPNETKEVSLPELTVDHPKLWWPNGYGKANLYDYCLMVNTDGQVSDADTVSVGIRQIKHSWNSHTRSMQLAVNGCKIFIKGGNWIISDAMLRFSAKRYDAELRYHHDMNLNLIRVWGGALPERPEFYAACNKYGLMVIQDFWMSGDCNGRWVDPKKADDQWVRRKYPDDHQLFIKSAVDVVKMLRNNPSLALWCGGNEIVPPADIFHALKDSIIPDIDGTRFLIDYSNSDLMSYNSMGGNGDGPYGIQNDSVFWQQRTWPFNSEVGSVGIGDEVSLKRFLPKANQVIPIEHAGSEAVSDSVWTYHKYIGYGKSVDAYGHPKSMSEFAKKAQLVNYNQYRALIEGFSSHMWDWYTGTIIWKTQNPWTAMRGQMYDYYLDPNAGLYGLRNGSEPVHVMCNPVSKMVYVVNNKLTNQYDLMLRARIYGAEGKVKIATQVFVYMNPSSVKPILSLKEALEKAGMNENGAFLDLQLLDINQKVISDNFYWFPDSTGNYPCLQNMNASKLNVAVKRINQDKLEVCLSNPKDAPIAFFNRISVENRKTGERILPFFASDNYVSLLPGDKKVVTINYAGSKSPICVTVEGWNMKKQCFSIK